MLNFNPNYPKFLLQNSESTAGGKLPPIEQSSKYQSQIEQQRVALLLPPSTYEIFPEWGNNISQIQSDCAALTYRDIHSPAGHGVWYSRAHLRYRYTAANPWNDFQASGENADRLREALTSQFVQQRFEDLSGKKLNLQLCRINKMIAGDYIGEHSHDSNQLNIILTVKEADSGGEYTYRQLKKDQSSEDGIGIDGNMRVTAKYPPGTLIINRGLNEYVSRVNSGERYTIVWLYDITDK